MYHYLQLSKYPWGLERYINACKTQNFLGRIELLLSVQCFIEFELFLVSLEPGKFCWRDVSKVAASIFKREVTSSYFTWFQDSEKTLELKMFMFEWIVVYDESILILLGLAKARKTNPTPLVRPFSLTNPCFPLFKLKLIPKFSHRTFPHHLGGHCCD